MEGAYRGRDVGTDDCRLEANARVSDVQPEDEACASEDGRKEQLKREAQNAFGIPETISTRTCRCEVVGWIGLESPVQVQACRG